METLTIIHHSHHKIQWLAWNRGLKRMGFAMICRPLIRASTIEGNCETQAIDLGEWMPEIKTLSARAHLAPLSDPFTLIW